jgi:hypothetical protein
MNNPFGNKIPDTKGFANDQASKVQGLGEGKLNDAKGFGEGKLNDAKGFGEGKLNDAKGFGEGKLNDAKGFGEGKLNDAKGFGEGKLNDAKGFGEGKLNDAKGFGEGKLNDAKGMGNNFSIPIGNKGAGIDKTSSFSAQGGEGKIPGAQSSGIGGPSSGAAGSLSGGAFKSKESPISGSNKPATASSGPQASAGSPAASGTSAAPNNSGATTNNTKPKIYIVQPDDDLGLIAKKFRLPSWKYLYQINKDKIGDNPDLLKAGTELTIPQWDSTKGDELIRAKGADPFAYIGGLQYRYPVVPFSATFVNKKGEIVNKQNDNEKIKYELKDTVSGNILASGEVQSGEDLELLIPDSQKMDVSFTRSK